MKPNFIVLLLVSTLSAFAQSDVARAIDAQTLESRAQYNDSVRRAENQRFHDSMREGIDNIIQARLLTLQMNRIKQLETDAAKMDQARYDAQVAERQKAAVNADIDRRAESVRMKMAESDPLVIERKKALTEWEKETQKQDAWFSLASPGFADMAIEELVSRSELAKRELKVGEYMDGVKASFSKYKLAHQPATVSTAKTNDIFDRIAPTPAPSAP